VQNPPNDGTLTVTGALKVNVDGPGGFDIAADGRALAALAQSGGTRIYSIDLTTGKAKVIGKVGRGSILTGLAVAPRGV
jgi:6-phosphogluconolactonase (cycloisomerase 2 family)